MRKIGIGATAAVGFALLMIGAAAAPTAMAQDRYGGDPCQPEDVICRLDRIERRLDRLIGILERLPRSGGDGRTVEMQTNVICGTSSCVEEAGQLCRTAGFNRGVALEIQPTTFSGRLVRAACLD